MLPHNVSRLLEESHRGVLTTFRRNGSAQMSIVTCGEFRGGAAFTTTRRRAKAINLGRNPRCSLLVSQENWWGYAVLEGKAEILSPVNVPAEELGLVLRDIYRAASGKEHPDWNEYDRAMKEEGRVGIIVHPERVYGTRV